MAQTTRGAGAKRVLSSTLKIPVVRDPLGLVFVEEGGSDVRRPAQYRHARAPRAHP